MKDELRVEVRERAKAMVRARDVGQRRSAAMCGGGRETDRGWVWEGTEDGRAAGGLSAHPPCLHGDLPILERARRRPLRAFISTVRRARAEQSETRILDASRRDFIGSCAALHGLDVGARTHLDVSCISFASRRCLGPLSSPFAPTLHHRLSPAPITSPDGSCPRGSSRRVDGASRRGVQGLHTSCSATRLRDESNEAGWVRSPLGVQEVSATHTMLCERPCVTHESSAPCPSSARQR